MNKGNCRLPPQYLVFSWKKFQENRWIFIAQIASVIILSITLMHPRFLDFMEATGSTHVIFSLFLIGVFFWWREFSAKWEVYIIREHIYFACNNKVVCNIPLENNESLSLEVSNAPVSSMLKGTLFLDVKLDGDTKMRMPTYSCQLPEVIAMTITQFINCHTELVKNAIVKKHIERN